MVDLLHHIVLKQQTGNKQQSLMLISSIKMIQVCEMAELLLTKIYFGPHLLAGDCG